MSEIEAQHFSHDEALALAHLKHKDSNLARCYIDLDAQLAAKDALIGKIMTAIGWLIPPFVDENTSKEELLQRIKFCVADADRAVKAAALKEDTNG